MRGTAVEQYVSAVLPAGEYFVGDPCYAFESQQVWVGLLEAAGYESCPPLLEAHAGGRSFTAAATAYGDGVYSDGVRSYPVDAGMLGVVPVGSADCVPDGMHRHTFDFPFTVASAGGVITMGDIRMDTSGDGW